MNELRRAQKDFLDSISESPTETEYRDKCYQDWLKSTGPKERVDGAHS